MNFKEKNIQALEEYFASGCKKDRFLGVELEHFVIDRATGLSLPYENGLEKILTLLHPLYGKAVFSQGRIVGLTRNKQSENPKTLAAEISLEPASQLEISIFPSSSLVEIQNTYDEFTSIIAPVLHETGSELICTGYQPKSIPRELQLIPKQRYEFMDEYFKDTGTHGLEMMRGTAAAQVSIDYEDEPDFITKFRVANILSPIFSFITDTTGRMLRTHIWNNVDAQRSVIAKSALDKAYGFREYAEYIYAMPPIFITSNNRAIFTREKTTCEIFENRLLSPEDIEHVTSMAFPDIRLKNRIEIRSADSLPIAETLAVTAFIKSIFYDKKNLNALLHETKEIKAQDVAIAKTALIRHGINAEIYKKPLTFWIKKLLEYVQNTKKDEESSFLRPIEEKLAEILQKKIF
ncbi:MAG: glutamate-cysteine ligase family protein [Defluviitaleaceae bacterium]|nr:glutamate-cysteine ligase family protein [Defluviitaleaceae bacterium]